MNCPLCGWRAVGKVTLNSYYCWDCCVEFKENLGNIEIYNVEMDGTLSEYGDPIEINEDFGTQCDIRAL